MNFFVLFTQEGRKEQVFTATKWYKSLIRKKLEKLENNLVL